MPSWEVHRRIPRVNTPWGSLRMRYTANERVFFLALWLFPCVEIQLLLSGQIPPNSYLPLTVLHWIFRRVDRNPETSPKNPQRIFSLQTPLFEWITPPFLSGIIPMYFSITPRVSLNYPVNLSQGQNTGGSTEGQKSLYSIYIGGYAIRLTLP